MSAPSNLYKLNGNDLYDVYGLVVTGGSDDLVKFPKRKDTLINNWRESDGSQYDLTNPKFEDTPVTLNCCLIADSEANFWAQYTALLTAFSMSGTLALEVVELGKTFSIFYKETSKAERLSRIKNTTKIGMNLDIIFQVTGYADSYGPIPGVNVVNIVNQNNIKIDEVVAPGEYQVIQFSGIKDDGNGVYENSIIDI